MTNDDETKFVNISLPTGTSRAEREGFLRLCKVLATVPLDPFCPWSESAYSRGRR